MSKFVAHLSISRVEDDTATVDYMTTGRVEFASAELPTPISNTSFEAGDLGLLVADIRVAAREVLREYHAGLRVKSNASDAAEALAKFAASEMVAAQFSDAKVA